ncbi:MAG TPA: aldo/keto reductase [Roseiflexaceae bacterium]|nr:aldo/keto reductase [Roseiflexaceae bacterium]HMP41798.1 aldo/keto reductase [Roseiflexaceae bacterium]
MKRRAFGATGMQVSEIGLGAWQLANPDWHLHDTNEALQIVYRSLEAGCNFFDTAPGYSNGLSEEILGKGLKAAPRQDVIICTKYSHHNPERPDEDDFDTKHIREVLEGSLRRLQTDYVDMLLLHNPPRELMDGRVATQYEELERLKTEGKIREYGVSLDWKSELELVVETTQSKAIEVMYNAFYQEPRDAFPLAQQHGVGLIVKVPLDSGWLSGRYRGDTRFTDVRNRWPPEVLARRAALLERFAALVPPGMSLAHAALQYTLARPEVSTVIPGAKSVEQALDNFAAADTRLPDAVVQAIDAIWDADLAANPLPW